MEPFQIESPNPDKLLFVLAAYKNDVKYYPVIESQLCNAIPLDKNVYNFFSKLGKVNSKEEDILQEYNFSVPIPKNVLYFKTDFRHIVWTTPPMKKKIYFHKGHGLKTGEYNLPSLVWILKNKDLSIFAFKTTKKGEMVYCHAPFANVYSHGGVCMGNVNLDTKETNYLYIMSRVQNLFFESYFTHSNNDVFKSYIPYLKKNMNKDIPFDESKLKEANTTFKSFIS